MPAPFISAKLVGTKEISASLDAFVNKQKNTYTPNALNQAADLGVRIAQQKVHVISGKLKASIGKKPIGKNSIEIHAITEYAGIENSRSGTKGALGKHNYFDQSKEEVRRQFPKIIQTNIEKNLRENNARTG